MAEFGQRNVGPARSNIYTVLLAIAFLMLVSAIGYVWFRSVSLFDDSNPFKVPGHASATWVHRV